MVTVVIKRLAVYLALAVFASSCGNSDTPPTVGAATDTRQPSPTTPVTVTIPAVSMPPAATAAGYAENIGDDLFAESCALMLNMRTWLETDRDKGVAQLKKSIAAAERYRLSAENYITDTVELKKFQDAMLAVSSTGESVLVALAAFDLSGLMYIGEMIGLMQGADSAARTHLGLAPMGPCEEVAQVSG